MSNFQDFHNLILKVDKTLKKTFDYLLQSWSVAQSYIGLFSEYSQRWS